MSQCHFANFPNVTAAETGVNGMPYEALRDIRRPGPVHYRDGSCQGVLYWLITGRDEIDFISRFMRLALAVVLACFLVASCSDGSDNRESGEATHAGNVATLVSLLPADTRGVFAVDLAALLSGESSGDVTALLAGEGGDPIFDEQFAAIGWLAGTIDVSGEMASALLAQTTDATDGLFLLATLRNDTLEEVVVGAMPESAGTYGAKSRALYVDGNGNYLTLLPGSLLVIGEKSAVESVVDVFDGATPAGASDIVPFFKALDVATHISLVYGLPALFRDVTPDGTLRGAAVMSGAFNVVGGDIAGSMVFHTLQRCAICQGIQRSQPVRGRGREPVGGAADPG